MEIGAWLGLSSLLLSAALAFSGYRTTRVTAFTQRIDLLERKIRDLEIDNERCKNNLDAVREDVEWWKRRAMDKGQGDRDRHGSD